MPRTTAGCLQHPANSALGGGRSMPKRFLKESIKTSHTLKQLSDGAFRTFMNLIVTQDDYGRFHGDLDVLRSACYPFADRPKVKFEKEIGELVDSGLLRFYQVGERTFCLLETFIDHQGAPRAQNSKFPAPTDSKGDIICMQMNADSLDVRIPNSDVRGSVSDIRDTPPTPSQEGSANGHKPWPSPEALVELYNSESADELPEIRTISPARRKKAAQY